VADVAPALYFRMVRAGFGQKRKQLANSLSAGLALPKAEAVGLLEAAAIEPSRRAETVTLAEWGELTRRYAAREPTARS
jgi:16S rRNA (adenine1518-N6/adenine1519-N6)-dimethyltransferase